MSRKRSAVALFFAVAGLAGVGATIPASPAFGAGKVVHLSGGVAVTVAAGWAVDHSASDSVSIHHGSPKGEFSLLATGAITTTVNQADQSHLSEFAQGFDLKHLKPSAPQQLSAPGPAFDEISQINFSGTLLGKKLVGAAVEFQNSKTGNGAFATVIANQGAKSALKKGANAMFNSILADSTSS